MLRPMERRQAAEVERVRGPLNDTPSQLTSFREALLSRTSKHSGPIKALQFNPFRHGLLASAGAKGEVRPSVAPVDMSLTLPQLFISDLNNIANPYRMGNSVARADDFECLDWNNNVPHITVTGSSGGFVTVWDVKTKKESLTLNNMGRKAVSAVAWDPNKVSYCPLAFALVLLIGGTAYKACHGCTTGYRPSNSGVGFAECERT